VGKNVAVFVDVANIFYAAKAAGVDIDYVTLLKSATAGRDFVRAYAYTGLDPDNENQRNFHSFLARNHYKVVSKDIRKYGDGKVKANLDIELVVDMMKTARNLDVAIVVSGDGDFAPAIRAVQEMGVRVEVISFRGNTSSDLIEVADLFTDITQLARVEKGSSRSGRRVASDGEEDLSMTEVPDKQTEGTGTSRGRGRGRGRGRPGEAEPVAARGSASRNGSRGGETAAAATAATATSAASAAGLTVMPGEKLSRAGTAAEAGEAVLGGDDDIEATPFDAGDTGDGGDDAVDADGQRRRRRRGGRGRGRGRGREQVAGSAPDGEAVAGGPDLDELEDEDEDEDEEENVAAAPRAPQPTPFGSVWDSQLGVASSRPTPLPRISDDEEDLDEPEIPEYLIAEQRRGQGGRGQGGGRGPGGQGGRGGRPARGSYGAAIDRERYGRGGGGGINRYPDVGDRGAAPSRGGGGGGGGGGRQQPSYGRGDRGPRQDRPDRAPAPRPSSSEPWSEVPEELEAMLRAQLAQSPKAAPRPATPAFGGTTDASAAAAVTEASAPAPKRRTRRTSAEPAADAAAVSQPTEAETPAPKRRTTRRAATTSADDAATGAAEAVEEAAPKKRATRTTKSATTRTAKSTSSRTKAAAPSDAAADAPGDEAAAPKRRTTRKKAEPA
jgi:uncharacterized LabA/DUF88 family protein